MADKKQNKKINIGQMIYAACSVFVWEVLEEFIEEGLALTITTLIVKTFSIVGLIIATQGIKTILKSIVKRITYKEGNDKMKGIKNYFTLMWGNKITGTSAGVLGAGLVYFQTLLPQIAGIWYFALIAFAVCYNLSALLGGETLSQILERYAQKLLTKEENVKIKEAEIKAKEIAKKIDEKYKELLLVKSEELKLEAENIVKAESEVIEQVIN